MATAKVCDRCGAVINPPYSGLYIEREKALTSVSEWYRKALRPENSSQYNNGERAAYKTALDEINSIPAADVAPVRHGRWIQKEKFYPEIEKQMD